MAKSEKTFALSMSGGSSGCLSYVSFVETLKQEYKLTPSLYSGLSGGAIVAPLLSLGWSFDQIFDTINRLPLHKILNFTLKDFELLDHRKIIAYLRNQLPVQTFEELPVPVVIFASDVMRQKTEVIDSGDLASAIIASCSVYPLLNPIKRLGKLLTDGGYSTYYGAQYLRHRGHSTVVGIDVCGVNEGTAPRFIKPFYRSLNTAVTLNARHELETHPPTIDIRLSIKTPLFFHLEQNRQYLYDVGATAAREYQAQISRAVHEHAH